MSHKRILSIAPGQEELWDFTIKNIAVFGAMYTNKEGKPRFNLFKFVAI